jgi:hypothetical protein
LSKLLFSGRILFLTGANHRKKDEHRKDKNLFHIKSKLQLVLRNSKKANGRPTVSQTKLNAGSESGIVWRDWGLFLPQSLNTFQPMVEPITTEIDFILRYRIEHERVIGKEGMTQGKDFSALRCNAVHENVGSVRNLCWSGSDGTKIDYDLPRSADFSATGRIRCGEQVCCITDFQTRVVLDKFNALANALPIWKSAIQQVWKPALQDSRCRGFSLRDLAFSGYATPETGPGESRLRADASSIARAWYEGRN